MGKSQLKLLKTSLRESGVTGPQKSKRQRQNDYKEGKNKEQSLSRASALDSIRSKYNQFEIKTSSRGPKRDVASAKTKSSNILGRPGISKGLDEELRRKKLLGELQQRHKVGGIVDRRFGEDDPTLTPEERAHERFIKEKQRGNKKSGSFDLEADEFDERDGNLTHLGAPLDLTANVVDDYEDSDGQISQVDESEEIFNQRAQKRRKLEDLSEVGGTQLDTQADRPKTKQEVMKEIIAKSKLHKYERQQTKEDDDELRGELDMDIKKVLDLMKPRSSLQKKIKESNDLQKASHIIEKGREEADREYDRQLRAMTLEARSKPTTRTKTAEEVAEEEARRAKEYEEKRIRHMNGDLDGSDSEDADPGRYTELIDENSDDDGFGLGKGILRQSFRQDLDVEDEDDFDLDPDLIASGSEVDYLSSNDNSLAESGASDDQESLSGDEIDEEIEFVKELLTEEDVGRRGIYDQGSQSERNESSGHLSSILPCPSSHEELLEVTKGVDSMELITVIQHVRALHSPKLDGRNKVKLSIFAPILIDHLVYLSDKDAPAQFLVLEQIIRHIHSLSKSYPIEVANGFRKHLETIANNRPLALRAGDLVLLTAIGQIFPTSDHFHQVVTPAMVCMAWYLGQSKVTCLGDLVKGAYVCAQFLEYQKLSKRYIPEVVTYILMGLEALAPTAPKVVSALTPKRELDEKFRIKGIPSESRLLDFWDIKFSSNDSSEVDGVKQALVGNLIALVSFMSEIWLNKCAFIEIMGPLEQILSHYLSKGCIAHLSATLTREVRSSQVKLSRLIAQARVDRQPLALHNHKPMPIKMAIPKFEDKFNPEIKSYDPNRDRVESSKLRAEYKKERKGALRELRKDANFIARESLRQKKDADAEYEKKFRRLVAEIQGEEGREANAYAREKRWRQGKK